MPKCSTFYERNVSCYSLSNKFLIAGTTCPWLWYESHQSVCQVSQASKRTLDSMGSVSPHQDPKHLLFCAPSRGISWNSRSHQFWNAAIHGQLQRGSNRGQNIFRQRRGPRFYLQLPRRRQEQHICRWHGDQPGIGRIFETRRRYRSTVATGFVVVLNIRVLCSASIGYSDLMK